MLYTLEKSLKRNIQNSSRKLKESKSQIILNTYNNEAEFALKQF